MAWNGRGPPPLPFRALLPVLPSPVSLLLRRCRRLIDPHAEAQPHRVQDFLDLVQALPAEVLGLQHLALGLLNQLTNRPDVRVLQAVVGPDRELELFDALVEILVADARTWLVDRRFGLLFAALLEIDEDVQVVTTHVGRQRTRVPSID